LQTFEGLNWTEDEHELAGHEQLMSSVMYLANEIIKSERSQGKFLQAVYTIQVHEISKHQTSMALSLQVQQPMVVTTAMLTVSHWVGQLSPRARLIREKLLPKGNQFQPQFVELL